MKSSSTPVRTRPMLPANFVVLEGLSYIIAILNISHPFYFYLGPAIIGLSCCGVPANPLLSFMYVACLFFLAKLLK